MTSWLNYAKALLSYYLGTQNDKYLLTQDGLKLWIVDHEYQPFAKVSSAWAGLSKMASGWTGLPKN